MEQNIIKNIRLKRQPEGFNGDELAQMLEQAYLNRRRVSGFSQKKTFSPSSIAYGHGTCPRYWNLAFQGGNAVDNNSATSIAVMLNGSVSGERIKDLFKDAGVLIDAEVEITLLDPPVRGFIDVLVDWKGETIVGEIKTTRQEAFLHRQSTMKPTAYHMYQILLYLEATKSKYGFFLYENKNTQEFVVIPVEMDAKNRQIIDDALAWMREVYAANDLDIKRPFKQTNKICQNCPFYVSCWNLPDGDTLIPVMKVAKP